MSRDTLTVGEGRRIVGELLTGLGVEQAKTIDTEQPGDGEPLTVQTFRETMRGSLRSVFVAVSKEGPGPEKQGESESSFSPGYFFLEMDVDVYQCVGAIRALGALVGAQRDSGNISTRNDGNWILSGIEYTLDLLTDDLEEILMSWTVEKCNNPHLVGAAKEWLAERRQQSGGEHE